MDSGSSAEKGLAALRSLDFFMGLAFTAIGVFMCLSSVGMFRDPVLRNTLVVSNPGMTPAVIGALLILMGIALAGIGLSGTKRPLADGRQALRSLVRSKAFGRALIVLGLIALYFFVFWGRLPYALATFLYLVLNMWVFKAGTWWKIGLISAVTVAVVVYFFGYLAKVPLP